MPFWKACTQSLTIDDKVNSGHLSEDVMQINSFDNSVVITLDIRETWSSEPSNLNAPN